VAGRWRREFIALLAQDHTSVHNLSDPRGAAQPVTAIPSFGSYADILLT
jgi:hypothetical protein